MLFSAKVALFITGSLIVHAAPSQWSEGKSSRHFRLRGRDGSRANGLRESVRVVRTTYHMKKLEGDSNVLANEAFVEHQVKRHRESPRIGRVLLRYVSDAFVDATPFGSVQQHEFGIILREQLQIAGARLSTRPRGKLALRWEAVDKLAARTRPPAPAI